MRFLTVLAAVVVTLFTAGPAAASEQEWERIACFSGAIDRAEVTEGDFLRLAGYLDCSVPKGVTGPAFGYARYPSIGDGVINAVALRPYGYEAPAKFDEKGRIGLSKSPFGICVVTDYTVRVACVKVTWGGPGMPVLVEPLATDDPLVDRTSVLVWDWTGNPVCGYC